MQSTPRTLYVVVNCNYIGNDRSCTRSHVDVTATETVSENGQNRSHFRDEVKVRYFLYDHFQYDHFDHSKTKNQHNHHLVFSSENTDPQRLVTAKSKDDEY